MRTISEAESLKHRNAVVFPVVTALPDPLEIGETVYLTDKQFPGLYIYMGDKKWVTIQSPMNNIFEEHTAVEKQQMFNLKTSYPTNGKSINVYINGNRLSKDSYVEASETGILLKDEDMCKEGDKVEFQIFNKYVEREHYTRPLF